MSRPCSSPDELNKPRQIFQRPPCDRRLIGYANMLIPRQPERNAAILAFVAQGLSYSEAGRRCGCSRNAVAGVVGRARKRVSPP